MKKVKGRWKNLIHSMFRHLLRKEKSHNVAIVRSLAMKRKILDKRFGHLKKDYKFNNEGHANTMQVVGGNTSLASR